MFIRILIFAIVTISYWKFNSLILFCLLTRTCRKKTIELFCHFAQWRECFAPQWDGTSAATSMLKTHLKQIIFHWFSKVRIEIGRSWWKVNGQKCTKRMVLTENERAKELKNTAQGKVGGPKLEIGRHWKSESFTFRRTIHFWAMLHRYLWWILETKRVGDKFEMLMTDLISAISSMKKHQHHEKSPS